MVKVKHIYNNYLSDLEDEINEFLKAEDKWLIDIKYESVVIRRYQDSKSGVYTADIRTHAYIIYNERKGEVYDEDDDETENY